jgi:hypothetical protein
MKYLASWFGRVLVVANTREKAEDYFGNLVRATAVHEESLGLLEKHKVAGATVVRLDLEEEKFLQESRPKIYRRE